jgi:spectinomycin phosphotransferase
MLEKPELADETIVARLRESYGLPVAAVEFLPIGNDASAWVYRVRVRAEASYFLKLKRGRPATASLLVPRYLNDSGIAQVVAPILTASRAPWAELGDFTLLLYPFIDGRSGMQIGLSQRQWQALGAIVRQIHAARLPPKLRAAVCKETFTPKWSGVVNQLHRRIAGREHDDRSARELAAFWGEKRAAIGAIVERTEALGRALQRAPPALVLCHADIHTANVLVDARQRLWIVDWDETLLAPKERDLMFVFDGGVGARAQEAFFRGYGTAAADPVALAYYRYEWVVQEIGDYGQRVFLAQGLGEETRADAVKGFVGLFQPGDVVDAALAAEALLPPELKESK